MSYFNSTQMYFSDFLNSVSNSFGDMTADTLTLLRLWNWEVTKIINYKSRIPSLKGELKSQLDIRWNHWPQSETWPNFWSLIQSHGTKYFFDKYFLYIISKSFDIVHSNNYWLWIGNFRTNIRYVIHIMYIKLRTISYFSLLYSV